MSLAFLKGRASRFDRNVELEAGKEGGGPPTEGLGAGGWMKGENAEVGDSLIEDDKEEGKNEMGRTDGWMDGWIGWIE